MPVRDGDLLRSDQAEADELLGTVIANRRLFKSNFAWDLPDIRSSGTALKALGVLVNDWQVSGVCAGQCSLRSAGFRVCEENRVNSQKAQLPN